MNDSPISVPISRVMYEELVKFARLNGRQLRSVVDQAVSALVTSARNGRDDDMAKAMVARDKQERDRKAEIDDAAREYRDSIKRYPMRDDPNEPEMIATLAGLRKYRPR